MKHAICMQLCPHYVVVDRATGGTAAACTLIEKMSGKIIECSFIIDLPDIGGRARLENLGIYALKLSVDAIYGVRP